MQRKFYLFIMVSLLGYTATSCQSIDKEAKEQNQQSPEVPKEDPDAELSDYYGPGTTYTQWTGPGWYHGVWFRSSYEYDNWRRRNPRSGHRGVHRGGHRQGHDGSGRHRGGGRRGGGRRR